MKKQEAALHTTVTFRVEDLMKTLAFTRDEAIRYINDPDASDGCRRAWYYSTLGAYDLARDMGWITEAEREWFYSELDRLAPINHEPMLGPALEEDDEPEYDPLHELMIDRANELGVIVRG